MKIVIVPGNGGNDIHTTHWYEWLKQALTSKGLTVIVENLPDAVLARAKYWLPFIEETLQADKDTIFIGHSSGAVAGLRYAESHQLKGLILVGACHTDLGDENEKQSGYFDTPWNWKKIQKNTEWIVQFSSTDDPFIPISEPRHIHEQLESEYYEHNSRGHFGSPGRPEPTFPELVEVVLEKSAQDR